VDLPTFTTPSSITSSTASTAEERARTKDVCRNIPVDPYRVDLSDAGGARGRKRE